MKSSLLKRKLIGALGSVIAFAGLVLVGPSAVASTSAVPWTDPHVDGSLTLCGRNDQPVTSGSLLTVPFVWSVVSSSPAPKGYTGAYLLVYQPIQYVDPADWSGYQLTDEAIFTNSAHPKAQATNADLPLLFVDHDYPPHWDNLYELRMYFTGVRKQPVTSFYSAAVIRLSGESWSLVQGGATPCNSGTATSVESVMLPKSEIDSPQTLVVGPAGAQSASGSGSSKAVNTAGSEASNSASSAHSQPPVPSTTASSSATTRVAKSALSTAGNGSKGSGSDPALIAAVVVVLVAGAGAAGVFLWRRRHLAASHSR